MPPTLPTLLLIDAGNTRVKWAMAPADADAPGRWLTSGGVAHADLGTLAAAWRDAGCAVSRVVLSNVAGAATGAALADAIAAAFAGAPTVECFASLPALAGVRNGYRDPHRLGCDRFASLIGARALFPGRPLVVVTCGTATTVDALDADGFFPGGMILPGLGTMAQSLAGNTAQLPRIADAALAGGLPGCIADHTEAAIAAGCLAAQAGAIERACAAHAVRSGAEPLCLLSGGAAAYVAPSLRIGYRSIPQLVLTGLHAGSLRRPFLQPLSPSGASSER